MYKYQHHCLKEDAWLIKADVLIKPGRSAWYKKYTSRSVLQ